FICVGTPSLTNGDLNLSYVLNVINDIYNYYENSCSKMNINLVIRSTVKPGTINKLLTDLNNKISKNNYNVYMNPEFLREGSAVSDFYDTEIIIGSFEGKSGEIFNNVYHFINKDIKNTSIIAAEMIKYVNNSYHALKVAFTNEIASICNSINSDPFEVMDLFTSDKKLNISDKYFRPGFAYGGSCLPKDLNAIESLAKQNNINVPILSSIKISNNYQIQKLFSLINSVDANKIGFYGITFKNNTDDLRGSPLIEAIDNILDLDLDKDIVIYDFDIDVEILTGINKKYYQILISKGVKFVNKEDEFFNKSDTLIVSKKIKDFSLINEKTNIIDLVNIEELKGFNNYIGFNWN
ncbi:UDP-glucose/GDP-mannose dehydrogenase family protein, partial [archaeon]|nr:UDP-glucose/GDP-mannose dehydrogenase family protein [archaeon]